LCDVCAVAEDEVQAAVCTLPGRPRVVNLEPTRLGEVFDAIRQVGRATDRGAVAEGVVATLESRVARVTERSASIAQRPRVALLEWLDPPFSCGHWTPELVRLAGGIEVLGREGERSRSLTWSEISVADPDVIFVACCGFGVERTLEEIRVIAGGPWGALRAVKSGNVYVTDGSHYFSRPGPRLVDSLEQLANALHPEFHPLDSAIPSALRLEAARLPVRTPFVPH
jgi:iron complex transport system substrate-binding protein